MKSIPALFLLFACGAACEHPGVHTDSDIDSEVADTDTDIDTDTGTVDTTIGTQIMFWPDSAPNGQPGGYVLQQPIGTDCNVLTLYTDDDGVPRLLPLGEAREGDTLRGATLNGDETATFYTYTAVCDQMSWEVSGNSCISEEVQEDYGVVIILDFASFEVALESAAWTQRGATVDCP